MAHIRLPSGLPGILGPLTFRPEMAKPLQELAEALLRGPSLLTPAERELIATYVSSKNDCYFCQTTHGAVATHYLGDDAELVEAVKRNPESAAISDKLKALLRIAGKTQEGGCNVSTEDVVRARLSGATDVEIHDTVLIAAAFCMYNRYVDGLATWAPRDPTAYREPGARLATRGYVCSTEGLRATVKSPLTRG